MGFKRETWVTVGIIADRWNAVELKTTASESFLPIMGFLSSRVVLGSYKGKGKD